jgi:hypothetical protein
MNGKEAALREENERLSIDSVALDKIITAIDDWRFSMRDLYDIIEDIDKIISERHLTERMMIDSVALDKIITIVDGVKTGAKYTTNDLHLIITEIEKIISERHD